MRGKEDDGQSSCRTTAAYRSGGLLGHGGNRWMVNVVVDGWMPCLFPGRRLPGNCDLTQHPCSLYCTLNKETTASALFSPAVDVSITCMKDMNYRSIGFILRWYAALWLQARTPSLLFQSALRAGAFSEKRWEKHD